MSFRFYEQLESNDCGPACVRMVAYANGKKASPDYIKSFCEFSRAGISVKDIIYCLSHVGMSAVAVNISSDKLKGAPLPAILYWEKKHFVVLYKVRQTANNCYFYIADPCFGKVKIEEDLFVKKWQNDSSGIAILSEPADAVKAYGEKEKHKVSFSDFANKYSKDKLKLFAALFFLLFATLINWFIPQVFQKVIDRGVNASNMDAVYRLAIVQGVLVISYLLASNVSNIILMKVNLKVSIHYLEGLLEKYMKLPISFFESKLRTDLMLRLDDQNRLQSFLTYKILDFGYYFLNFMVFSVLLMYYDAFIFFVFFALSVLSFAWTLSFLKKRKFLDYKRFAEQSTNNNIIYEIINGMPEIKICNDERNRLDAWGESQMELNNVSLKSLMLNYYQLWGANVFDRTRDILILIIASSLVINNTFSLGVLVTITYIIGQLAGSLDRIHFFIRELQDARISLMRLSEIYSKEEENVGLVHLSDKRLNIKLDNVKFRYPGLGSPDVINGLSLEMKPGTITAIVGNSGCGKTTIVKLLLGFYAPQRGSIFINGKNMREISVSEWRKKCGCVLQDGYVFSDTIAKNISMGTKDIDYKRLEFVSKAACIDDYIMSLPLKYETVVGSGGLELSGGQKQRLLIARALYKNPDYLIFDEATSSLDTENEAKIMSNLYEFFREKSMLIIAHRLSTVVRADKILFMENGSIVEQGTHDELCKMKGLYYKLVKNQIQLS